MLVVYQDEYEVFITTEAKEAEMVHKWFTMGGRKLEDY